jgi:hypothetical protein
MSAAAISALERGVRRAPYRATVALLVEALGVEAADAAALATAAERGRRRVAPAGEGPGVRILVSAAGSDDEGDGDAKGFVSTLCDHLRYYYRLCGLPAPDIVQSAAASTAESDILIVVLSPAWLADDGLVGQAVAFGQKRILVSQAPVPGAAPPAALAGAVEFCFYRANPEANGDIVRFFRAPKPSPEFVRTAERLARYCIQASTEPAALPPVSVVENAVERSGRTVYLAKPAADMRAPYLRLFEELNLRGHRVVPAPEVDIPSESAHAARAFVEAALAEADLAIHLLGERMGFCPDDGDPIVRLQLAAAAQRAEASGDGSPVRRNFRRIIWAPAFLVDEADPAAAVSRRDPLDVVHRFDRHVSGDKIDGSEFPRFVDFVVEAVGEENPLPEVAAPLEADSRVYVFHKLEDADYAVQIARALQEREIEPVFPVFEGDPVEVRDWEHRQLRDCDAVLMCWAGAPEVWVVAQSEQLRNWRTLGRSKRFSCRSLVAGPPPGVRKSVRVAVPPRKQFDLVLDLTGYEVIPPSGLDPLIAFLPARGGPDLTEVT